MNRVRLHQMVLVAVTGELQGDRVSLAAFFANDLAGATGAFATTRCNTQAFAQIAQRIRA